ncbi:MULTISPECIES: T6SS effector BTH_I2691 family protein [unclassified Pseudomonas]|uniref:T6SS effector BTH_I2691 family protein n=1 Tax=unclassified Pseudomonas TaxID=196821 RepID=UPI000A1EE28C|nr:MULTISPECIES: T6SS effector BTH_I2691 family protein [unclassified Pseudomonas]
MGFSQDIANLITETDFLLTPCKACQRQGLPILPLRRAVVPDTRPGSDPATQTRMGLRTLRSGYLYVLLDQRIWHAYEVTAQGHLRRFNPYEPNLGPPPSLPERCVHDDHDIPSSFLNVDTDTYGSAWLAFSSDPWPVSVLQAYESGRAPAQRFEGLDLIQARKHPELLGLAMTPENLQVDRQVFEYAQQLNGPFDSAHGFHSRFLRKTALRGYLVNAMARHQLENGVLAVVLDDTVGLIQEYNHQRLNWVIKRQAWREDPLRAYQLQTSQILQIIRATQREWAAQKVPMTSEPQTGDGPPLFTAPEVERQRIVEMHQRESDEKLEERYDEPRRAAFHAEYDQEEARFQAFIDRHASTYANLCENAAFALIEQHDYDGRDRESGIAYSKTIAACLAGGITEAPPTNSEPAPGTSETLWLKWLQDPNSPPYRALLLRDGPLMAALLPSFSPTEPINWNDSEKLYNALSKFITSEDAGLKMRDSLKQAITELQGAVNAASLRLQARLDPGIQHAVRHLNSASQRIYNGVHLIELQVQMKLGEYYALQSAHLRELQNSASKKLAEARAQMMPDLEDVKAGIFRQAEKVKPIIQTGLLSLAVLDPKVAHQVIPVSVWVAGTAHDLHERLAREVKLNVNQLNDAAKMALVDVKVAAGTLELDARKTLNGMKISAGQASQLVRDSFSGLRRTGRGWELLLSLGGLYLMNDSLEKNLKIVEEEIGPKSNEAMMALYGSSLGLLGGEIELLGLLMPHRAKIENRFSIGRTVARTGAAISAITGLFDSIQALLAMRRSSTSGDETSYEWYRYTFIAGILSTVFSTAAVFYPIMFGPLGIAIVLGFVTYTLMKTATESESTPLERWARRCYFGNANESPRIHWDSPNYADIAISELNACTLGLTNGLTFVTVKAEHATSPKIGGLVNLETNTTLKFRIMLPQFTEGTSGYLWALIIHRSGDGNPPDHTGGEVIASEQYFVPSLTTRTANHTSLAPSKRPRTPDYKADTIKITNTNQKLPQPQDNYNLKVITGTVELTPVIGRHNILSATLVSAYWPDRNIPDAVAEVKIQEEKQ